MQLVALCASKQIELQFATIGNESLITRARNTLVQLFMDGDYTHLLFIDADLAFNPESVLRMVDFNKDVVTGVYPRKTIDWTKVKNKVIDDCNTAKIIKKNGSIWLGLSDKLISTREYNTLRSINNLF